MESFQRLWSDQVWILGQNCLIGLLCFPPQRHVRSLVAVFWWFQHTFWISKLYSVLDISHDFVSTVVTEFEIVLLTKKYNISDWQLYLLFSCCLQIYSGEHNKFFSFCCLLPRLLCPWNFPDKNTRVRCHFLLEGIFLTQGSNLHLLCLLHWLPWWLRQ